MLPPVRLPLLAAGILAAATAAHGQGIGGGIVVEDAATLIDQKLGASVARDVPFVDQDGKRVTIGDYLTDRPLIVHPQYFSCPSVCGVVLHNLLATLKGMDLEPGRDFGILAVSFDHREQTALAAHKKASVLEVFGKPGAEAHWHFLTSDSQSDIRRFTDSLGFGFRWNETRKDFDHKPVVVLLSPDGKITRYLRGDQVDSRTLRLAVVEASQGRVGSAMDRLVLSCYGYDPLTGKYSRIGPLAMSVGGALTLLGLAALLLGLWRHERRQAIPAPAS